MMDHVVKFDPIVVLLGLLKRLKSSEFAKWAHESLEIVRNCDPAD